MKSADRLAVDKRTALKMFCGKLTPPCKTLAQPSPGYYYADEVSLKITELKGVLHVI